MKICIIIFSLLLPLLIESGIQTKTSSEEYVIFYENKNVTIKHYYKLKIIEYKPPIPTDSSRVYQDLKYHYDQLDNTYIKFK